MFGFLYRRSDFFRIKQDDQAADSVVGFIPGQNSKLLMAVFNKWEKFAQNERDNEHKILQADIPPAVTEEEIATSATPPGILKSLSYENFIVFFSFDFCPPIILNHT